MDTEKELKQIEEDIKTIFKEKANEVKEKLSSWSKRIIDLKIIQAGSDKEKAEQAKKSEEYAWAALLCVYAQTSKTVEKEAWSFAEKVLKLFRNVLLVP